MAGTRALSAIVGSLLVATIAYIGCRNFGWRVGLLATAIAATGALFVQQSRFVGESGPTALLWGLSVAGFFEGRRTGRPLGFAVAGLAGGLSIYFYPSARLWVAGGAATLIVLFLYHRSNRRRVLAGAVVTAVAALIAVAPFLTHLSYHPNELSERFQETSVLAPENQTRLRYLHPPVGTAEMLAIQFERTLGMFDRYEDGQSFLQTHSPAFPMPLGAITLVGLAYAVARAWRDSRYAILALWFELGMAGVALTVETPDFLRASSGLVTFPFFAALVLTAFVDRLAALVERGRAGAGERR